MSVWNVFEGGNSYGQGKYSNLLCKSGITTATGHCSSGFTSKSIGQLCMKNSDCMSKEDSQEFSDCTCTLNTNGNKRCELLNNDKPWQQAIEDFKIYYQKTQKCHVADRWGECGETAHYNQWKCSHYKALYYNIL